MDVPPRIQILPDGASRTRQIPVRHPVGEGSWQASTGCSAGTCDWPCSTTFDTDYRIELFEEVGEGYFRVEQVEGSTGKDIAFVMRLKATTPFVGS